MIEMLKIIDIKDIDLIVGELSERSSSKEVIGPTFACIIGAQFERLKFGDRFYYQHLGQAGSLTENQFNEIRKTTLAGVIYNNGENVTEIQTNAFQLIRYRLINYNQLN